MNHIQERLSLPQEMNSLFHDVCYVQPLAPWIRLTTARSSGIVQRRSIHFKRFFVCYLYFFALSIVRDLLLLRSGPSFSVPRRKMKRITKHMAINSMLNYRLGQVAEVGHVKGPEHTVAGFLTCSDNSYCRKECK